MTASTRRSSRPSGGGGGGGAGRNFGIILLQIDRYETMREAYGQAFCDNCAEARWRNA
jgi:hypothetical protein